MAHVQKFTKGNMQGLSIHLDRKTENHSNKNIDTERTHLNYDLCEKDGDTLSRMDERLSEVYCMNRKDVKVCCEWIVTLPESLHNESVEYQRKFFEETYEFLTDRYGGQENVVSANVHNDETTPHMHFDFVPVVWDEKKEREKVSAKEVLTRSELKSFHTDLDRHLKERIPEIYQEGILNDKTIGIENIHSLKKYSAEIEQQKEEMANEFKSFKYPQKVLKSIEREVEKKTVGVFKLLLIGVRNMVELLVASLFFVLAFFMLQGKGAFLIAGFNTLSKEEQAQYDQSALAKFVGKLMLLIGCCVLLFLIESLWVTLVSTAIVIIAPLAAVIYMNTGQRFRKHE